MVSTRSHPVQFPPPDLSPTKSTSPASPSKRTSRPTAAAGSGSDDSTSALAVPRARARARSVSAWSHTPSATTLIWLLVSLPLVLWDCGYVLLRPHSMPGGKLHRPLWVPYELYGTVDYLYGFPALESRDGFTGAQGAMNVVETLAYAVYLYIAFAYGRPEMRKKGPVALLGRRKIVGKEAGLAVLIGFAAAVMTLSKTVLYWLHNYYSGWDSIGHNDTATLIFLWIIPNGAWLILPTYLTYLFGSEILAGLEQAAGLPQRKSQ